jgi:hypothetical protein
MRIPHARGRRISRRRGTTVYVYGNSALPTQVKEASPWLRYRNGSGGLAFAGGSRQPPHDAEDPSGQRAVTGRLAMTVRNRVLPKPAPSAGRVTVRTGKVEIGQGVLTAMRQIAAEELDVAPDRITMESGDTEPTPNEGYTSGSQSIQFGGQFRTLNDIFGRWRRRSALCLCGIGAVRRASYRPFRLSMCTNAARRPCAGPGWAGPGPVCNAQRRLCIAAPASGHLGRILLLSIAKPPLATESRVVHRIFALRQIIPLPAVSPHHTVSSRQTV